VRPEREAVINAAISLVDATLGITVSESLKHPKHTNKLVPLRLLAREVIVQYFDTQKRALLRVIKPRLVQYPAQFIRRCRKTSKRVCPGNSTTCATIPSFSASASKRFEWNQ
jgi:hypothetical protein